VNQGYLISYFVKGFFIEWFFPSSLRLRGVGTYTPGLEVCGLNLAKIYNLDLIEFNDEDIVLDCGANLGELLLYLGSLDKKLNYHAIEPGLEESKSLSLNFKDTNFPNVNKNLHTNALADKNRIETFFYSPKGADSSLIEIENYDYKYQVNCITLDDLVKSLGLSGKRIKLFKLEGEGYEPEILIGAKNTLSNIEFIAADLGPERGLKQECTVSEVSQILSNNNFEMIKFGHPRITALYRNKNFPKE
jgi:FkbM family methyltransferase